MIEKIDWIETKYKVVGKTPQAWRKGNIPENNPIFDTLQEAIECELAMLWEEVGPKLTEILGSKDATLWELVARHWDRFEPLIRVLSEKKE